MHQQTHYCSNLSTLVTLPKPQILPLKNKTISNAISEPTKHVKSIYNEGAAKISGMISPCHSNDMYGIRPWWDGLIKGKIVALLCSLFCWHGSGPQFFLETNMSAN